MNTKAIITTILFVILCVKFGQGLQCYKHDYCLSCPNLTTTIGSCASNEDKCWKLTTPTGTARGCSNDRCAAQIDFSVIKTGYLCCSENLCNSSVQIKITTIAIVFMSLIAFACTWYFQ